MMIDFVSETTSNLFGRQGLSNWMTNYVTPLRRSVDKLASQLKKIVLLLRNIWKFLHFFRR